MACREAAHEADQKAKLAAKKYADRKAIERDIPEGSLVLALIPTAKEKLETPWRGPYKILKKLSPTSYLIEVPEARKKKKDKFMSTRSRNGLNQRLKSWRPV